MLSIAVDQVSESPVEELDDDEDKDSDEKGAFPYIVCVVYLA